MLRINLGCGRNHKDGYINIDNDELVNPDLKKHIMELDYPEGSVDVIYLSHVLEHLPLSSEATLIKHMVRWLKKGGTLKIAVPDIETICMFIAGGNTELILWHWLYGSGEDNPMSHFWGYTKEILKQILEGQGFRVVGEFSGEGDDSDFKYQGIPLSINLECVKE